MYIKVAKQFNPFSSLTRLFSFPPTTTVLLNLTTAVANSIFSRLELYRRPISLLNLLCLLPTASNQTTGPAAVLRYQLGSASIRRQFCEQPIVSLFGLFLILGNLGSSQNLLLYGNTLSLFFYFSSYSDFWLLVVA